MARQTLKRKQAKTFSLSEDVIQAVENHRSESGTQSLTAALEDIVREWKRTQLAAQFTAYYDSVADQSLEEDKKWGEFSESQI